MYFGQLPEQFAMLQRHLGPYHAAADLGQPLAHAVKRLRCLFAGVKRLLLVRPFGQFHQASRVRGT